MSRELKAFLIDTLYRCVWTFSETFLGCITVGGTIADIHWKISLSISGAATLVCLLKQIGKYCKEHFQAQGQDDDIEYIGEVYDEDYAEEEDIEEGEAE